MSDSSDQQLSHVKENMETYPHFYLSFLILVFISQPLTVEQKAPF